MTVFLLELSGSNIQSLPLTRNLYPCEGGAALFRSLLEHDLVDQLNLTIAPYLFGGADAPTLTGLSKEFLPKSVA